MNSLALFMMMRYSDLFVAAKSFRNMPDAHQYSYGIILFNEKLGASFDERKFMDPDLGRCEFTGKIVESGRHCYKRLSIN